MVLGSKNKYCLAVGSIDLGTVLIFYAMEKSKNLQKLIFEVNEELSNVDSQDFIYIAELNKYKKQLLKQKNFTCVMFYLFAAFLVFLGFVNLF